MRKIAPPVRPFAPRGQGMVEFALVLPLLVLLMLLAVDFGRVFFGWVGLQNAARIGANHASLYPEADWTNPSDPHRQEYVVRIEEDAEAINCELPDPLPIPDFPSGTDVGDDAVVELTCGFSLITPFISGITGNPIELNADAIFPIRTGALAPTGVTPPGGGGGGGGGACIPVPDLEDLTVGDARLAWINAGFSGTFFPAPSAGQDAEIVVSQFPLQDECRDAVTTVMTVDSDPDTTACPAGEARVPKLMTLSMENAETTWSATFSGTYTPPVENSNKGKTVNWQSLNVGECQPTTAGITVTFVNGQLKCKVPNFIGSHSSGAQSTWTAPGFETTVQFLGTPHYTINQQSVVSGSDVKCDEGITVGP